MQTIHLKFYDADAAEQFLSVLGFSTDSTSAEIKGIRMDCARIGVLYEDTCAVDVDGNAITAALDGWHVNLLWHGQEIAPNWPQIVYPSTPSVQFVW